MANSQHIAQLLEGVCKWNNRRSGNPDFIPDFECADIRKRLSARYDSPYPLQRANFNNARFRGAVLTGANLSGATFVDADLTNADLSGCILTGACLVGAKLDNTDLRNTPLAGANLAGVNLCQARIFSRRHVHSPDQSFSTIDSIACLLDACSRLGDTYATDDYAFYYRGEPKSCWSLRPAVMRKPKSAESIREYEAEMLVDLMSRWPDPFDSEKAAISYWVRAQHHGLKTRLLDVTRNPNVALHNACSKHRKKDGVVHTFVVPRCLIKPYSSDTISVIANYARLSHADRNVLIGRIGGQKGLVEYKSSLGRLYHFIRQEKPYFEELINPLDLVRVFLVEPQQQFERIRAQSGAFIVSAFHERLERRQILSHNPDIPTYLHYRTPVSHQRKGAILKELQMINVTDETLFPSLDEAAGAVTDRYRSKSSRPKVVRGEAEGRGG